MMTHILSNLPEAYHNIVETLEENLDDDNDTITIERILDKISVKYHQMDVQSETKTSREDKKPL